jgi:hypothetical protein
MNLSRLSDQALKTKLHSTLNKVDNIRMQNYNHSTQPVLAHYVSLVADIKAEQRKRQKGAK